MTPTLALEVQPLVLKYIELKALKLPTPIQQLDISKLENEICYTKLHNYIQTIVFSKAKTFTSEQKLCLVQECKINSVHALRKYNPDKKALFLTWATYYINKAVYSAFEKLEKQWAEVELDTESTLFKDLPEASIDRIMEMLCKRNPEMAKVVYLYHVAGWSKVEIQVLLDLSEHHVETRLRESQNLLRIHFKE